MFEDVRTQERVELTRMAPLLRAELLDRVGFKTPRSCFCHRMRIVIDPDTPAVEVGQVAPNAAAHVEHKAEIQPAHIPAVGSLNV